jgi:hypothetical protein
MQRAQLLRQLVLDSQYLIDDETLAQAIVARVATRGLIPGTVFRNDARALQVRSFRPSNQARSFRPCGVRISRIPPADRRRRR